MNAKVVLVTGSTAGIGREVAIHLAKKGAKVVVTGRNKQSLDEVVAECQKVAPNGCSPLGIQADLLNEEEVKQLVQTTVDTFGKLDVLLNSAGMGASTPINDNQILNSYDKVMNLNVKSVLHLIHLAVPHLEKTQGNIINVSAIVSMRPVSTWTVYCMSKAAMDMMTGCLALELGPKKIRVNSVNPGFTKTTFQERMGFSEDMVNAYAEAIVGRTALRRTGTSADVAQAIEFLASENASFITGTCLPVEGGFLHGPGVPFND